MKTATIIRSVPSGNHELPRAMIRSEQWSRFEMLWDWNAGQRQRTGGYIDVSQEFVSRLLAVHKPRAPNDQRDHDPFVVAELLAPGVADPMIGKEEDDRLVRDSLTLQAIDNLLDVTVDHCERI